MRGDVQGDSKECFTIATFCTLTGLTPSSDYEVFVAVRTSAGQGPFSAAVYVTLDDPGMITVILLALNVGITRGVRGEVFQCVRCL